VYEREPSRGARGQGGMLDIHSGQRALREAGLIDRFYAIARGEGQDMRLLTPDGTLLLPAQDDQIRPGSRPSAGPPRDHHGATHAEYGVASGSRPATLILG